MSLGRGMLCDEFEGRVPLRAPAPERAAEELGQLGLSLLNMRYVPAHRHFLKFVKTHTQSDIFITLHLRMLWPVV